MSKLTDKDLIYNVFVSYCRVKYYILGLSRSEFDIDIKARDAVAYNLSKIGIWSDRLSNEFKEKYSDFPWAWLGMLNNEFFLSEEEIWEIIKSKENGILIYFEQVEKMFVAENPDEAKKLEIRSNPNRTRDNVPLSTNYKYPIHSKSSQWTVKKK